MPHLAALRLAVLRRLVLRVVRRDRLVVDLHVRGHLLEDRLRDDLRADVRANLLVRQPLILQLLLVLLRVAAEVLLLDLLEPRVDLLVGHLDVQLLGLLLELDALDEELDDLVLQRLELLRAGLRELALLGLVALLRLRDDRVEFRLRDLLAVDDGHGVLRHLFVATAAGGDERENESREKKQA